MKVIELLARLNEMPPEMQIEFSYKMSGTYSDDADVYFDPVKECAINSARGSVVLE